MLLFPGTIAVATILFTTRASSVHSEITPSVHIVPPSLRNAIPRCSRFCVDDFIRSNYPPIVCPDLTNIDCLCAKNSTSGFTIEEATIRCVASSCWNADAFSTSRFLDICAGVPGALPNTHPTLTATFSATSPSASETEEPTTTSDSSTPTTTMTTTPSTTTTTQETGTGWISATGSNGAQETAAPPSTPPVELSNPVIAGISILGSSAIILGGVLIFLWLRRRRRRAMVSKGDLADDGGDSLHDPPWQEFGAGAEQSYNHEATRWDNGAVDGQPSPATTQLVRPPAVAVTKPPNPSAPTDQIDEIGVAIYPDQPEGSPGSQNSQRTLSELLPDKPNISLYPEPLRLSHRGTQTRRESSATVFEEDIASRRGFDLPAAHVAGCSHGVGLPADPRALMYAMERRNRSIPYGPARASAQPSNTELSMPSEGDYRNFTTMPTLPHEHEHMHHGGSTVQIPVCPNKHCSSHALSDFSATRGSEWQACGHRHHSHSNPQMYTRGSFASDSSFESHLEDNEDYDLPDRTNRVVDRLSPVQESSSSANPGQSPPHSANSVTYPKIPRSTAVSQQAEAVHEPRAAFFMKVPAPSRQPQKSAKSMSFAPSPPPQGQHPQHSVDLYLCPHHSSSESRTRSESPSASTLLAKRRGDTVADKMESSLRFSSNLNPMPHNDTNHGSRHRAKWNVVEEEVQSGEDYSQNHNHNHNRKNSARANNNKLDSPSLAPLSTTRVPEKHDSQEVKLTPTRKGHDLFLNVE